MTIVLSKTGSEHLNADRNRQDFVVSLPGIKVVLDGCGEMLFSEVGATLFGQMLAEEYTEREKFGRVQLSPENFVDAVWAIFDKLSFVASTDVLRYNDLSFTILTCFEMEDEFVILSCGDGYIILRSDDEITTVELSDGEYPKYFVYNYIEDKTLLEEYQEGVSFTVNRFCKTDYDNVGVATDGWRFVDGLEPLEKIKLYEFLKTDKKGKIAMLINRNIRVFKDDISIVF